MQISAKAARALLAPLVFFLLMATVAWHSYAYPAYGIDILGYMENASVLETSNASRIHAAVYGEVRSSLPAGVRDHLLGIENRTQDWQSSSLRDRSNNAEHFAEFLPCFAIRPLYIELLHLFRKSGASLVRATVLGSVLPYMVLAALLFGWSRLYVGPVYASVLTFMLVITPPIWNLSRISEPDCLSTLWACLALYLIFEHSRLTAGLAFLLSSIYVRTDNVLLALFVLAHLSLVTKEVDRWKALVLAAVAVTSVYTINHFAGDYGWRMLYYRGFFGPPLAPGEFVAQFTPADYKRALRSGIVELINGTFVPYLLLGVIGYLAPEGKALKKVFVIVALFSAMHFVIFPLAEDRYLALFYAVAGLAAIAGLPLAEKAAYEEGRLQST